MFLATDEKKFRSFLIKHNMGAIVTIIQFHGFEIKYSGKCTLRNLHPKTLEHVFGFCAVVASFWENVSSWFSSKLVECLLNQHKQ